MRPYLLLPTDDVHDRSRPLDVSRLVAELAPAVAACVDVLVEDEVDSTNTRLLAAPAPQPARLTVLLAESQTAGRGRGGHAWDSGRGQGLWMSVALHHADRPARLSGLSLVVGVVAARVIAQSCGITVRLKWPNDLLVGDDKIGGILIETAGVRAAAQTVVIGIGINTGAGEALFPGRTSIAALTQQPVDRNRLAAMLITELHAMWPVFLSEGFSVYRSAWLAHAAWLGELVSVSDGRYCGAMVGVDDHGRLQLSVDGSGIETLPIGVFNLRRIV